MEDIQSWWEVPSIAYFCSLFRTAFNLLDFDIEELEEALLTDGTEESASSLLTELIVRLLNGCLGNNDISAFNYQMYLRRLFRRKCQETGRYNAFNTDIDFQFLPLRTKVEILYALCDFRLDADDVFDLFKNLEAESLRVEPLGFDNNQSAYWYFYGTRLYREDIIRKPKGKSKKRKSKESKKRGWFYGDDWLDDDETQRVWQVVCFTEEDWIHLTEKFSKATSKVEKELYRSLSQNFLPEIPRLFQEKERLQRKRLLESAPRRTSSRVLQKIKQKEEEIKQNTHDVVDEESKETPDLARENRAKKRNLLRSKSVSSDSSDNSSSEKIKMHQKRSKSQDKRSKNSSSTHKGEPPPEQPVKSGRKTNNSLACATGQILIPDNDEPPVNSTRKKLKTSQIFSQSHEDIQTDMYKVIEQLTAHEDAWPFMDPVEEEYAPNYYTVIRRPMDLRKMEERLDNGYYTDFSMFKADFKLIVNNCRLYNGQDNEYTTMVDNLQVAFDRLTEKYIHRLSSSDEEIAVEYQIPTPSRKHKIKSSESPTRHKRKKRKSHSDAGELRSGSSDRAHEEKQRSESPDNEVKKSSESRHKHKQDKGKKKRKGHRHGKHSKNHKKGSHKSQHSESSKSKHSKKQKHAKNKEGKKSKQKKKKSKHHHDIESSPVMKRTVSHESLESSNRSRSASPLPSIHTPSPTPSEFEQPDQLGDSDFFKDKYDKIKERRRHAAKDAWESLFDYRQKSVDKQKQNLHIPEKDKNQKLRETIEKLKAKNEKYKESSLFNSLFASGHRNMDKNLDSCNAKEPSSKDGNDTNLTDDDTPEHIKSKSGSKKGHKKNTAKNESASEALEQAVKDISKWLDDAPKGSVASSPCDSPAQTISTEDYDNSRLDDEFSQGEKAIHARKDTSRKRPSSREPKLIKRREIQRTIDRLQPGKSKGNLLSNTNMSKNAEKIEEVAPLGPLNKVRDSNKGEESSPKLSLGSVLPTVEFTLGNDHNFSNNEENKTENPKVSPKKVIKNDKPAKPEEHPVEKKADCSTMTCNKKDAEVETEPTTLIKPSQEKATPNLSAWFKAFGTPKNTTTSTVVKKKTDESEFEDKTIDNKNSDSKPTTSPKGATKYDSPNDHDTPNPDDGDSPLPSISATPRQRRTSTGSSVSERSSFSQDPDSPRHQMSHTSPLLRSPASPRTDDFQKITYPIINGTVRAGFYQDTTSIKSSPEKSCSPREAPQSPYSPYSQHVYASNNVMGSSTPNYFVDHNKSPLPTYTQNPAAYYDTAKVIKPARVHDDYTSLGPESFQQNQYSGPFSPTISSAQTQPSNYSQKQHSPQHAISPSTPVNSTQTMPDPKTTLFPVKKRTYNESELSSVTAKKALETKSVAAITSTKNDYQKLPQSIQSTSSHSTTSVDDIALALSEKSEMAKLNSLREKNAMEFIDRQNNENRETVIYDDSENHDENKKELTSIDLNKPIGIIKNDNVDMVNMGYMNPENDRRNSSEVHDVDYSIGRDIPKLNLNPQQKGYEVETIAINLGLNNPQLQKTSKQILNNTTPAHSHDRTHSDIHLTNPTLAHALHSQYDSSGQSISNFSLNDIELANKKLYSCNTSPAVAIDYGNWKMSNQMRKQDLMPSDYSTTYNSNNADKLKNESTTNSTAINYNKNVQHQQFNNYNNAPRTIQRTQEIQQNLPAELRIPNPRNLLKTDHLNSSSSISDSNLIAKNVDTVAKSQKTDKLIQNHPLVSSIPYKAPYSSHSSLPLESLRNLPNIPQMLERYTNDERYLSSFASSSSSLYHDKTFQMAQMFNKSISSEVHPVSTSSVPIYSQPATPISKDPNIYKTSNSTSQVETKSKNKRKRTSDSKATPIVGSQGYHASSCSTDVLSSVKSSMMSGSAFNFGSSSNMTLGSSLYGDNAGFTIEDFRNSTANQLMAANYMAAAVAHQRSNAEANADKLVKPAHQNTSHTSSSFPFIGHSQVRAGYPFVGADAASPLYQQYLHRHQEELIRQTGAQIMSLYPSGYPGSLSVRQPYDSINRPSWL